MTFVQKSFTIDQMSDELIPESVKEFIANNIDSIAELEAVLLMRRDPLIHWTAPTLSERLYITPAQTAEAAAKLHALGLAGVEDEDSVTYHYQPASPEMDAMVGAVAEAYSKFLIPVTNLIHSKPKSKVQQFADAFRLRIKEDK